MLPSLVAASYIVKYFLNINKIASLLSFICFILRKLKNKLYRANVFCSSVICFRANYYGKFKEKT
jgi:type I restriction-modification system DNA methylase subunit